MTEMEGFNNRLGLEMSCNDKFHCKFNRVLKLKHFLLFTNAT